MFQTKITKHNLSSVGRNRAFVEHVLLALLPHGSGIDCDWKFDWFDNGNVAVRNSYHCMNDVGYYDGWADFTLRIAEKKPMQEFRLQFNGAAARRSARRNMLREYLEDSLSDALPDVTIGNVLNWFNEYRAYGKADAPAHILAAIQSFKE